MLAISSLVNVFKLEDVKPLICEDVIIAISEDVKFKTSEVFRPIKADDVRLVN